LHQLATKLVNIAAVILCFRLIVEGGDVEVGGSAPKSLPLVNHN